MSLPLRPPVIVRHMAACDEPYLPNSIAAVEAGLKDRASFIEVDVTALADRDYLLVHDPVLESETSGTGPVRGTSSEEARRLRIVHEERATDAAVPLLSDVVAAFLDHPGPTRLQLDYKDLVPFEDDEPLERLVEIIRPLADRVLVSSGADWQLRRLRRMAPWLDLGLDIHFYLDWHPPGRRVDPRAIPSQVGVYDYWDDHPLARERHGSTARYLANRCGMLVGLVPEVSTFYLNYRFLIRGLEDGFNWAEELHRVGIKLDAWTLDADHPDAQASARRLLVAGVDQFTTNTPGPLASLADIRIDQGPYPAGRLRVSITAKAGRAGMSTPRTITRRLLVAASILAPAFLRSLGTAIPAQAAPLVSASSPPLFVRGWGGKGTASGQFSQPFGVSLDASGNVYVADVGNNRIEKFTSQGSFLLQWGMAGSGNGQFNFPHGVAVDRLNAWVYVMDTVNNRIQKFDLNGAYLSQFGSAGAASGQLNAPTSAAIDGFGNLYVADSLNSRMQKFDSSGNFLLTWGSKGSGPGQFIQPVGPALDSAGNVYVADFKGNRVQVFDGGGTFRFQWGSLGSGNGQLDQPAGVSLDLVSGFVYVTDQKNARVQRFDLNGNYLTQWTQFITSTGQNHGSFRGPDGVVVAPSGNIYVADQSLNRVQLFRPQ